MKRRKFLAQSTRWMMVGGLLATSGLLVFRRSNGNPEDCYVTAFCQGCSQSRTCGKLAAVKPEIDKNNGGK